MSKFDNAMGVMGNFKKIYTTIDSLVGMGVNYIDASLPGCISIPPKAKGVYVYFTMQKDNASNLYVVGYSLTQIDEIIKIYQEDKFLHIIITSADTQEYGIPYIGSGDKLFNQYKNLNVNELCQYRLENGKWTILANVKDVEYLQYRMEVLNVGKVLTKGELANYVDTYKLLAAHQRYSGTAAIHQCILDLAIGFCKRTNY